MPLKLDIKRRLTARSDRVKSVDLHPTEPWMLASLYNGNVHIWNHESQQIIKSFEVCELPVRAARFVPRKNWVVTGSDDMQVRVFNYNTLDRVTAFEAHSDYVRCIAVHPAQPFILTSSDDMSIKLWNWDKSWACQQVFEGHTHYVMQIVINPKDNNTFASASLDRSVKVWQLGSSTPNFTLEGHEKGVNCVDYYYAGDKPYLISGADDRLVKIWDYQNKTCVQTLEGHAQNISSVVFHPELPIVMTGSEDGTVRVWHSNTYRLETTLNYGLERVWAICCLPGSNNIALGYDEGSIMIKLGREEPAMSMDQSGKIIWAKHSEIQQANLKALTDSEIKDGERLPLAIKDLGACEIYPQTIAHNPNGRFVVVCGDGEYIIYTAMALRNKAFGSALEFVWAVDSSEYAVRESNTSVKVFKNFKEKKQFKPEMTAEGIFGGAMLGVRSTSSLAFYEWDNLTLIRRIEIQARGVYWSENGELVCISTEDSYFVLRYSAEAVATSLETKEGLTDDAGIETAFDLLSEVQESVKTGLWVGDCFIYTNGVNRLNYYVGGEIVTVAHLDRVMYLLGYIPKENHLYLGDKELNIVSYALQLSVLEYQTAVMRRDFDTADRVLPSVPKEQRTRVAHFLEKQGFKQQALAVSTDPEHRFELALQLADLKLAYQLAVDAQSEHKWKQLADLATTKCQYDLAQECLHKAQDFGALLLLATVSGNGDMVNRLGDDAIAAGKNNVAFLTRFLRGDLSACLEILISTNRIPEAAFFARTYLPSQVSRVVQLWKVNLAQVNAKASQSLADPDQYDNLFPGLADALKTERFLEQKRTTRPASHYARVESNWTRRPVDEMLAAEEDGSFGYSVGAPAEEEETFVDAIPVTDISEHKVEIVAEAVVLDAGVDGSGAGAGEDEAEQVAEVKFDREELEVEEEERRVVEGLVVVKPEMCGRVVADVGASFVEGFQLGHAVLEVAQIADGVSATGVDDAEVEAVARVEEARVEAVVEPEAEVKVVAGPEAEVEAVAEPEALAEDEVAVPDIMAEVETCEPETVPNAEAQLSTSQPEVQVEVEVEPVQSDTSTVPEIQASPVLEAEPECRPSPSTEPQTQSTTALEPVAVNLAAQVNAASDLPPSATERIFDWRSVDGAGPPVSGQQSRLSSAPLDDDDSILKCDLLDQELEMDLENLELDENLDTSDFNLDDELLGD